MLLKAEVLYPKFYGELFEEEHGSKKDCSIQCGGCSIAYSLEHYIILFKNKKICYFAFQDPQDQLDEIEYSKGCLDTLCHSCLFKKIKKVCDGKIVDLVLLGDEYEYTCKFYPDECEAPDDEDESPPPWMMPEN